MLGSDGNNDTPPSAVDRAEFAVHVIAINAMGSYLLDYLQFGDLMHCARQRAAGHSYV